MPTGIRLSGGGRSTIIWQAWLDTIDTLYAEYNTFLHENGYGPQYDLGDAHMFVTEGMDKVRKVIEKNRKRKITKHKKIPNNTIIEIDNCSPLEILNLQRNLMRIARDRIRFRKRETQTGNPETL